MIIDNLAQAEPDALCPQVLVVGAGAVGIVLAITLARSGQRVLLIEGGPAEPPVDYREANQAASMGVPHRGLVEGRMKALGGTTRLWGGQLAAFSARDLAAETWPGKPAWPIAHADIEAATQRVFDLLAMPREAQNPAQLYGTFTGNSARLSDDVAITATAWLPQPDFARLFADELAHLPGLTVLTGHCVTQLCFSTPGQVDSVMARDSSGAQIAISARQVVLACGTFEIVRLLLVTQRDLACGFADNAHVGRWFIDHLHGVIGHFATIDRKQVQALLDPFWLAKHKYAVKLRISDEWQARAGLSNVAAMVLAPLSPRELAGELRGLVQRLFSGRASLGAVQLECTTRGCWLR